MARDLLPTPQNSARVILGRIRSDQQLCVGAHPVLCSPSLDEISDVTTTDIHLNDPSRCEHYILRWKESHLMIWVHGVIALVSSM